MEKFFFEEQPRHFEKKENREGQELKLEEKKNLVDAWLNIIVDNQKKPDNLESLNNQELKEWLYKTLMDDISKLGEEWHLQPEVDIEKIKTEKNPELKAKLEIDFIEALRIKIQEFKEVNFQKGRSNKWDSWPKNMRENRSFNCVGVTLLGMNLLEKAGIQSYYGNPFSHVLNIVKLSNGEWVYVDFLENKVKKIIPEEITIGGIPTLKLKEPDIIYRYIPLFDKKEVVGSILDNLNVLKNEIKNIEAEPKDKKEAERIFAKFEKDFQNNDFPFLKEKLYYSRLIFFQTKEMQEERQRIEKILKLSSLMRKYLEILNLQPEKIKEELITNIDDVERLFREDDKKIFDKVEPQTKEFLQLLFKEMENIKKENLDLYQELGELFINKIKS